MALYHPTFLVHDRPGGGMTGIFNTNTSTRSSRWIRTAKGRRVSHTTQVTVPTSTNPLLELAVFYAPHLTGLPSTALGYRYRGQGSLTGGGEGTRGPITGFSPNVYLSWIHDYFGPWFRVELRLKPPTTGKRFGTNTFHWTVF